MDDIDLNIISPEEFAQKIEDLVWEKDIEYIEAVILYCEQNNLEIDTAAAMIKTIENTQSKIREEAENLNFLPKTSRLPT